MWKLLRLWDKKPPHPGNRHDARRALTAVCPFLSRSFTLCKQQAMSLAGGITECARLCMKHGTRRA